MIKISKYLKQKGQGIVEYALLLAFVVGIAVALQGVGLKDAVVGVFDDVATVLAGGSSAKNNTYAASYAKYSQMKWNDLTDPATKAERLQADIDGLQSVADWFMGKSKDEVQALLTRDGNNGWSSITATMGDDMNFSGTGTIFEYADRDEFYKSNDKNYARYYARNTPVAELLGVGTEGDSDVGSTGDKWRYTGEKRYFFSDEMNSKTGAAEKQVKLNLQFSNGTVTSSHVWVEQKNNGNFNIDMSALDVQGKSK